ncbi:putative pectinesterase [Helianthus annuus]|nr:putative pectinesterase [Helianthus annuus]
MKNIMLVGDGMKYTIITVSRSVGGGSTTFDSATVRYQDTLYVHSQRQFYKECYIYGAVDFIFGNAAVVFQNCMIYGRRPMTSQKFTIAAQG